MADLYNTPLPTSHLHPRRTLLPQIPPTSQPPTSQPLPAQTSQPLLTQLLLTQPPPLSPTSQSSWIGIIIIIIGLIVAILSVVGLIDITTIEQDDIRERGIVLSIIGIITGIGIIVLGILSLSYYQESTGRERRGITIPIIILLVGIGLGASGVAILVRSTDQDNYKVNGIVSLSAGIIMSVIGLVGIILHYRN